MDVLVPWPYLITVQPPNGLPGLVLLGVAHVAVGAVGATELDHQSQLVYFPHNRKDWDKLVLKAVPRYPVAIHLTTLARWRAAPPWRRTSIDPLAMLLHNVVASGVLQFEQSPGDVLLVQGERGGGQHGERRKEGVSEIGN